MHNYKKLEVWNRALAFNKSIYNICKKLPPEEKFGLYSQITRASVSIMANIAEGSGRQYDKEMKQFISISLGSAYEVESFLLLIKELNWIQPDEEKILIEISEIQKMLQSLIKRF